MKLTNKQKRYLRENYRYKSDAVLAKKLGLSEDSVRKALSQLQLKRSEAELKALRNSKSKKRIIKEKAAVGKAPFFCRPIFFLLGGVSAVLLIILFVLPILISSKKAGYISEVEKLLKPVDISELNILFITLDTTRADHLGCYGYSKAETPNIDNLAKNGILFKNAVCQVPLTLPSHCSIFTGTYPFYHGVRDNGGFYLASDKTTLAEVLNQNGLATSAFIGAYVLDSRWGLEQGIEYYNDNFDFTKYKTISLDSVQRKGGEVVKAFFDWFEKNYKKRFFSWIHFYDPHTPYEPPEPYRTKFSKWERGLYDGEIAYVDHLIGRVLNELRQKDVLEKTLIVIVGDHGESLGQHQERTHGFFIYETTTSVPLIIHFPSSKLGGIKINECVETIDIMPTLLQILGLPIPQEVQGKSLLPLIMKKNYREEQLAYSESYFPRYHFGWSELMSLRDSRYKYIRAPRPELYDIVNDPNEVTNLFSQKIEIAKKFKQKLEVLRKELSAPGIEEEKPQKMDEKTLEKLKALGYVGGFTFRSKRSGVLPDPKDKIHLFNLIERAEGNFAQGKLNKALRIITEVIEEDPMIKEAHRIRARIFLKLDRLEEAIKECREALKIDPGFKEVIFSLALAYKRQKKYEKAVAEYKRIMELDPRDYKPVYNLGEVYMRMNDVDKAIFYLKKAIQLQPERSSMAHSLLGSAYLEKKMVQKAEAEFKKALETKLHIPDGHFQMALVYEERNEIGKAIEEYKKEIELHPKAYRAHFNLAKLYVKKGYMVKGINHFKEAIKYKKDFANGYLFLAKAYLDLGQNLDEAILLAEKGLKLAPQSEYAPLAHFILSDIYNRLGQVNKSREEFRKGRQLQQKLEKENKKNNLR